MTPFADKVADGRQAGVLTRDDIINALREYAELYGDGFAQSAFSPSQAKRNGRPELVEIYYRGRPDGSRWPSLNAIKTKFGGSWNAARAAAGFGPNSTGPAAGRRKHGDAEPILNVRERLVYVPHEKTRQLQTRVHRLEERLADVLASRERVRAELAQVKIERPLRIRSRKVDAVQPAVKTVVQKVSNGRAERALERAQAKLADEQAARRAAQDQLSSWQRERRRLEAELDQAHADAAEARLEARYARSERNGTLDRLNVMEGRVEALSESLEVAREQALGTAEARSASTVVREADKRAERAELRAAKAEREMAEQAAAITGEIRRLTAAEIKELRRRGPAGPAILADALKKLASARSRGTDPLRDALTDVASAAVMWRDRL